MAKSRTRRARSRGAERTHVTPDKLTAGDIQKLVGVPSLTQGNRTNQPQKQFGLFDAIALATGQNTLGLPFDVMPRDPRDDNAFGPGKPLDPSPLDAPDPSTGQPAPRVWEYPVSWNLPGNGRREVPWQVLITASVAIDIIRQCIETRKRDIRKLKWRFTVTDQAIQDAYESNPNAGREDAEGTLRKQWAPEIKRMMEFWCEPWASNEIDFGQWCNLVLEEVITLDALAVYPERAVAGNVLGFEVIDGSTIKPLLDVRGRRPQPPFPAYQQELYGFPRGEYAAAIEGYDDQGKPVFKGKTFTPAQLFYHRENVRSRSPYGLSEVEQALVSARLYLRRQGWMLAEYDDGSTPITWLTPPGDMANADRFTPATRRDWENGINADLGGDSGKRHRIKVGVPGWEVQQLTSVDERYKPEYDLHLIKLVAGHLHVPITRLGYTEAKGLGDTGYHEAQADVAGEIGEEPDVRMLTGIIMKLSRRFLDCPPEIELQFISPDAEDAQAEDAVADAQRKRATLTLNDDRRRLGLATLDFAEADMPIVFAGPTGLIFLEGAHAAQKAQEDLQMAAGQAQIASTLPPDEGAADEGDTGKAVSVSDELATYSRWQRRQRGVVPRRPFTFKAATPDQAELVGVALDPAWMAFQGFEWTEDIDKGSYLEWNAANPTHPRGPHGRFVKVGTVLDALESLGHKVVRNRPLTEHHENALDEAARRVSAGKPIKRGESQLADELEAHGLLEEFGGPGKNKDRLELSDAGRAHLVARAPEAYAEQLAPKPTPTESVKPLAGGAAGDTQLVTRPDGTRVVRKKINDEEGDRPAKEQADAEELGAKVAAVLGVRTPEIKRISDDTLEAEYLPGQSARQAHGNSVPADILAGDEGIRMGLLDRITSNTDRHAGNWMVTEGGIAAIDNGMMFDDSTTIGHNPFGNAHFDLDGPNPLTPEDAAALRPQLEALAPEFAAMGRSDWHRAMMERFDEVARGASGGAPSREVVARERQARIDRAKATADVAGELEQIHANDADAGMIKRRARGTAARHGVDDATALAAAIDAHGEDTGAMLATARQTAQDAGLVRGAAPGTVEPFDSARHEAIGARPKPGTPVEVVRPGYSFDPGDGEVRLSKAQVEERAPEPVPEGPHRDLSAEAEAGGPAAPSAVDVKTRMREAAAARRAARSSQTPETSGIVEPMTPEATPARREYDEASAALDAIDAEREIERAERGGLVSPQTTDRRVEAAKRTMRAQTALRKETETSSAPMVPPLGPGQYKSPEQIATDAAAYRVTAQGKIEALKAEREQWIAEHGGAKPTGIAKDYFDSNIRKWELRRDGAEHEVTPFGQLGIVPATAEQQAGMAAERAPAFEFRPVKLTTRQLGTLRSADNDSDSARGTVIGEPRTLEVLERHGLIQRTDATGKRMGRITPLGRQTLEAHQAKPATPGARLEQATRDAEASPTPDQLERAAAFEQQMADRDAMAAQAPRTDTRPRFETYKGRKIKVRKNPREWGTLETSINGEVIGHPYGTKPEDLDKHVEQLKRDIDAMDERRLTDPTAYPEAMYRGAPPVSTPHVPSADPTGGHADDDVTPEQRVRELDAMETREQAAAYLAGVKGKDLDALARQFNAGHRRTAADKRAAIVESAVGYKLNSRAIRDAMAGAYDPLEQSRAVQRGKDALVRSAPDAPTPRVPSADERQLEAQKASQQELRLKLERGVIMHGSDRATWSAQDRRDAERLDAQIAALDRQITAAQRRLKSKGK